MGITNDDLEDYLEQANKKIAKLEKDKEELLKWLNKDIEVCKKVLDNPILTDRQYYETIIKARNETIDYINNKK